MEFDQLESLIEWIYTSALVPVLWNRTVDKISELAGGLHSPKGDGDRSTDTESYLQSLQRHLQIAQTVHGMLREHFERRGIGQLLVDEHGQVALCDDTARSCLQHGGLSVDSGTVKAEVATQQARLDDAIRRVLSGNITDVVVALGRSGRATPLFATLSRVHLKVDDLLGPAKRVMMHLRDPEDFGHVDRSRLRALFSLTERESQLALAMVQGESLSTYARAIGVTRETARSHLKSLFRKVGVRGQSQLVSILLNTLR